MFAMNNIALLVFGLFGTYHLIRRAILLRAPEHLTDLTLVFWLIISLALAGFRGGGFPHYPIPAILPLALMAGIEISLNYQSWKTTSTKKQALFGAGIMTALIFINFFMEKLRSLSSVPAQQARSRNCISILTEA